jgi:hypothetical protein
MATEAQLRLFQALKAHTFELEIERDVASNRDREALDSRIEAARQLLEWLSKALELWPSPEFKRRGHQDPKLIRIKVRHPKPAGLEQPLSGNQPFDRNAYDLRKQHKLLADAISKLQGQDG